MSAEENLKKFKEIFDQSLKPITERLDKLETHGHGEAERPPVAGGVTPAPGGHDAHAPAGPNLAHSGSIDDVLKHARDCPNCRPKVDKFVEAEIKEKLGLTDHDLEEVECVNCGKKVKRITPKCPTCGNAEIGKHES